MPLRGKGKRWWNSVRDVSVTLFEVVRDSSDALPPLKSAAGFLTSSHKVVERIVCIPSTIDHLQFRLSTIDEKIQTHFPKTKELDKDLTKCLNRCILSCVEIAQELESVHASKRMLSQLIHLRRTERRLGSVSFKLDQAELHLHYLYTLHSQCRSNAIHNEIGLLNGAIMGLYQKEEQVHAVVSSIYKIVVFFRSGSA
ncbi:hypothetical protein DL96DRAFT_1625537 [Flagelloscypha sp. PMI_526]|nr:hypothetical protein DL96DRAFT_1625537 [Flagelloscypha sp. PMI_526]